MKAFLSLAGAVLAAGLVAGCGSTSTAGASSTNGPDKAQQKFTNVEPAMTTVALDIAAVQVTLGQLSDADPTGGLVAVAQAADKAHTDLKDARSGPFLDDSGLFGAATDLTASMGTLGDVTGDPNNAEIIAKFERQYTSAAAEWNAAVDKVAAAAGHDGKNYEISTPTS